MRRADRNMVTLLEQLNNLSMMVSTVYRPRVLFDFGDFEPSVWWQIANQVRQQIAHIQLQTFVRIAFKFAGQNCRDQPNEGSIGSVLGDGVEKQVPLRPILASDLSTALFVPVVHELF